MKLDDREQFINAIYKQTIWPRFQTEVLGKSKTAKAAIASWRKLSRDLVRPDVEFAAARWWMLDALRTGSRAITKLKLPEPSRPSALAQ